MIECLKLILSFLLDMLRVLFRIDVGFTSLGVVYCIVFILFPIVLAIVNFIKTTFVEELDERYDESRPRESWSFTESQNYNPTTGKASHVYHSHHTRRKSRRRR